MRRPRWRLVILGLCYATGPICLIDYFRRRARGAHGV